MRTRPPSLFRSLAPSLLIGLLAACSGDPEPCTSCLDVAGRFRTVRTIGQVQSCPQPPTGGDVPIVVVQNGSNVRFDYEGDALRGTLFSDQTAVASNTERPDARNLFRISREIEATFTEASGTVRLQATLRERQTPLSPEINEGRVCEFTATLQGER